MTISMYQASVPRLAHALRNLSALLEKASAHVEANKLDEAALTEFRLFPDMFHLRRQVQIACDTAKGLVARLAGVEVPAHDDNEVTLAELQQRIARTIAFVESFKQGAGLSARPCLAQCAFPYHHRIQHLAP